MRSSLIIILLSGIFSFLPAQDTLISNPDFQRLNQNFEPRPWNKVVGSAEVPLLSSGEKVMLDNFVCDAMLERTEADLAILNYGEAVGDIYRGEITELDIISILPIPRELAIVEVNGEFLQKLVEKTIAGVRNGAAISGARVEYNPLRPSQNRLTYFQIGEHPLYPKKDYRLVTTRYIVEGNTGCTSFKSLDSTKIFQTGLDLRTIVQEYISRYSTIDQTTHLSEPRMIKK